MRSGICSCLIIGVMLISCTNKKAAEFRNTVIEKQDQLTEMLISKEGLESRKLDLLTKYDYKGALSVVDSQEIKFNTLLREIEALDPGSLKMGLQLKQTCIDYLHAMKKLHLSERQQIEQEMIGREAQGEQLLKAQDSLLRLTAEKQKLFQQVYKAEEAYNETTRRFNKENGL